MLEKHVTTLTYKTSLNVLSDESQEKTTTLYECLPDSALKDTSHLAVNPLHPLLHAPHARFQAADLDGLVFAGTIRALTRHLREFFDGCGKLCVQLLLRANRICDILPYIRDFRLDPLQPVVLTTRASFKIR